VVFTCAPLHEGRILYLDLLANSLVYTAFYKPAILINA